MIFGLLILAVALFISAVAAFYSIAGLAAIFAAAVTPIIIMGVALEIGKIAATVWLHKYWHRCAVQFKLYLVPAILVLMLITSMGIFGFLSKAHMDQTVPAGDVAAQVQILDEKIATERANIDANKKALTQMDSQVDQLLGRTTDDKGASKAVQVRKSQAKERKSLQDDIAKSQKNIATIQTERAPIAAQVRKVEAEVGPIKYIAALIYGDNPDSNLLERAVRWVIILLVFVFDPLAIVLILAADQTFYWAQEDKQKKKEEDDPAYEADDGPLTDNQIETIKEASGVDQDMQMTEEFFARGKVIAKELDINNGYLNKEWSWPKNVSTDGLVPKQEPVVTNIPYADPAPLNPKPAPATDESPINPPPKAVIIHDNSQVTIPDFSINAETANPITAGFGTEFPSNPVRGDMFLRVDYLPSKLYKWIDIKWIEVDKERSDSFTYNEQYIKHLINKIDSGEYDVDMLSAAEQEQISRYLNNGKSTT